MRYRRVYRMLRSFGHGPEKAGQIVLDASRGDSFSLRWIRIVRGTMGRMADGQKEPQK